ncbi:hypothetical protein BAE44_0009640 [Dichanthelium oligosanthes]|uniref:Uncharacterized protein n=1 Tax=Dichanthelium oligosanthes TaxID=888268 RepID=A0A1E5VW53_9POAL|nr:hypothetical protein BAE44_0009640 [Dichanthelium oligosanthes]
MASSFNNRHWPSMFRSKHAAEPWQAQPDITSSPPPLIPSVGSNATNAGSFLKHPSSGYAGLSAADGGRLGAGVVTTTGASPVAVAAAAGAHQEEGGVAALCITDSATGKSVAHSVAAARLDVRAQFGEAAVLFRCAGERGLDLVEHVPVDASGCTVEPLQHGAFYYLLV